MKLLYIHQHFTTPDGTSGTRSYEFAKNLVKSGHSVTILCGSFGAGNTGLDGDFKQGKRSGVVSGINVIELSLQYSNKDNFLKRVSVFLGFAFKTLKIVHTLPKPDLIYATSTPLTVAIPALWGKLVRKIPYIFEVRDLWPELPIAMGVIRNPIIVWLLYKLEYFAYRNASACVGLSPGMLSGINRVYPKQKVMLIPNACDLTLFEDARSTYQKPNRNSDLCGRIQLNSDCFHFVFAGTLGLANGLDQLVRALCLVPTDVRASMHVHLIGDGNQRQQLEDMVNQLGLQKIVLFHKPIPKTQLVSILGYFDAGVLTLLDIPEFQYGTSPNKFFDYISAGLPVVNNYPGWVATMIDEHECGVFCKTSTDSEFAEKLIEISCMSREQRIEMSKNAYSLACEFNRDTMARRQLSLCEDVLLTNTNNIGASTQC